MRDLLNELVGGDVDFTKKENRIYVKFIGIKNANVIKQFMSNQGFNYVYGGYDEGVYELGFAEGEGF